MERNNEIIIMIHFSLKELPNIQHSNLFLLGFTRVIIAGRIVMNPVVAVSRESTEETSNQMLEQKAKAAAITI